MFRILANKWIIIFFRDWPRPNCKYYHIRWETLNESAKDRNVEEKDPKEVQVEQCLELYQRALRLHQKGRVEDAKALYKQVIEAEVMQEEVANKENEGSTTTQSNPVALLQYLVYKNYACIMEEEDKKFPPQSQNRQALQYYIKAVTVDPTDYNLWHRIGLIAKSGSRYRLARFAFESALAPVTRQSGDILAATPSGDILAATASGDRNNGTEDKSSHHNQPRHYHAYDPSQTATPVEMEPLQLGPVQWWCLEELCNVLYDIGDFSTCLHYVDIALAIHPDFERGGWLRRDLMQREGRIGTRLTDGSSRMAETAVVGERAVVDDFADMNARNPHTSGLFDAAPQPPSFFTLENHTWAGLGRLLLDAYDIVEQSKDHINDGSGQTSLTFLNRRIEIFMPAPPSPASTSSVSTIELPFTIDTDAAHTSLAAHYWEGEDVGRDRDAQTEASKPTLARHTEEPEAMAVDEDPEALAEPRRKRRASEEDAEKAEEKRSLRTSKRVRDKLDHEEISKRRREDEERALIAKVDVVLAKFGMSLASPGRMQLKQGLVETQVEVYGREEVTRFVEWVESRMSAMSTGPGEDLPPEAQGNFGTKTGASTRQATTIMRQFAIFVPRTNTFGYFFQESYESTSSLRHFVDEMNARNSGILDYLCRYVEHLMVGDVTPLRIDNDGSAGGPELLSEPAMKVLADVVDRLGEHLVRAMGSELDKADTMNVNENLEEMADVEETGPSNTKVGNKFSNDTVEFSLAISELVLDRGIALIVSAEDQHDEQRSRQEGRLREQSIADAARDQIATISRMLAVARRWTTLLEREVERTREGQALWVLRSGNRVVEDNGDKDASGMGVLREMSGREYSNLIRYFWIQARLRQAEEDVEDALRLFCLCKQLLKDRNDVVRLHNCCYDSVISLATANARIEALETQRYIVDADKRHLEKDYVGVVERLEPLFLVSNSFQSAVSGGNIVSTGSGLLERTMDEKMRLMGILADSYRALGHTDKLWLCYTRIFGDVVRMLLSSSSEPAINEAARTSYWRSMAILRAVLGEFMTCLPNEAGKECIRAMPARERNSLVASVCVVLRACLTYMFHHPAFLLLLSADADFSPPQASRSKVLSSVTVRAWVLFFHVIGFLQGDQPTGGEVVDELSTTVGMAKEERDTATSSAGQGREDVDRDAEEDSGKSIVQRDDTSGTTKESGSLASRAKRNQKITKANVVTELLDIVHNELGDRELCNEDDGIFLRYALRMFADAGRQAHRREIFQCYDCMYGVHLSVDAEYPDDHETDCRPLDREAAADLFELLAPYVSEKILKGAQMKGDVKDAFDDIAGQFGNPPSENALVAMNKEIIMQYLESELPFPHTEDFPRWCNLLPTVEVDSEHQKIPSIYFQIYFLRGKMFQGQVKNRAKLNQEKIMEDLKNAIEQYLFNLYLNPGHYKGWHALAVCYSGLAEEHLVWSASKIVLQNHQIADLQRKSFNCFTQAAKLSLTWHEETGRIRDDHSRKSMNADMASLWCEFGYHLYSMTCKPMSMAAFKRRLPKPVLNDDGSRRFVEEVEPKPSHTYKFALMCFGIALQLDDNDWRLHYMSGKCFGKLGRKPQQEILECYKEAIRKTPMRSGQPGQEKILEPIYKLTSCLAKFLWKGVIDPSVVSEYLAYDTYSTVLSEEPEDLSALENATKDDEKTHEHRKSMDMADDSASAFHHIFAKLTQIRGIDKRKWHHRPVYRVCNRLHLLIPMLPLIPTFRANIFF
ncbi:hypothetical protein BC938DRAFT_483927, partial [Jimgerdemannia flammicorona]